MLLFVLVVENARGATLDDTGEGRACLVAISEDKLRQLVTLLLADDAGRLVKKKQCN